VIGDAAPMATKKKASAAAPPTTTRATEHGASAYGAKDLRAGATLSAELDLEYALGRGSSFAPMSIAADLAPGKKAQDGVPRNRALHFLRGGRDADASKKDAPVDAAPLGDDEARALALREAKRGYVTSAYYLTLEACVGPSLVLSGMVEGLEATSVDSWRGGIHDHAVRSLYGLMLRARPEETEAARARLTSLFESLERELTYPPSSLGIMLFGRVAIARYGYKYLTKFASFGTSAEDAPSTPHDLVYCPGDGAWVAAQHAALWKVMGFRPRKWMLEPPPARLVFIGGDLLLETELAVVDKYPGTMQAAALAAYRDFRSPLATACIEKLAGAGSKVQKQAVECLEARAAAA
jgi:hypothetical protein